MTITLILVGSTGVSGYTLAGRETILVLKEVCLINNV
jgi:hypothetical protein